MKLCYMVHLRKESTDTRRIKGGFKQIPDSVYIDCMAFHSTKDDFYTDALRCKGIFFTFVTSQGSLKFN